jgi:hypothetical protein
VLCAVLCCAMLCCAVLCFTLLLCCAFCAAVHPHGPRGGCVSTDRVQQALGQQGCRTPTGQEVQPLLLLLEQLPAFCEGALSYIQLACMLFLGRFNTYSCYGTDTGNLQQSLVLLLTSHMQCLCHKL